MVGVCPLLDIAFIAFGYPGDVGIGGPLMDTPEFRAPEVLKPLEMDGLFYGPLGIPKSPVYGETEDTALP